MRRKTTRKPRRDKGIPRKSRNVTQPRVEFDHYEVMERAYLPTIQEVVDGSGSLQLWDMFLAGFRTAEQWTNNHYQSITPRVRGKETNA